MPASPTLVSPPRITSAFGLKLGLIEHPVAPLLPLEKLPYASKPIPKSAPLIPGSPETVYPKEPPAGPIAVSVFVPFLVKKLIPSAPSPPYCANINEISNPAAVGSGEL